MSRSQFKTTTVMEFEFFQKELNNAIRIIYNKGTRSQKASLKGLILRTCEMAEKIKMETEING